MKKILIIILITSSILLTSFFFRKSYSVEEELNLELYNTMSTDDIKKIISEIDKEIILTSRYDESDILNENYEFLYDFAILFIINHSSYYQDKFIIKDPYYYETEYGEILTTNKYIHVDEIYNITKNIFNIEYFKIINNIEIKDNLVPVISEKQSDIDINIETIKIKNDYNTTNIDIKYEDNDLIYTYIFQVIDNRMYLKNVVVGD